MSTDTDHEGDLALYICIPCGYVFDPALGDLTQGIAPGITFAELDDDWWCPACGVDKTQFARLDQEP